MIRYTNRTCWTSVTSANAATNRDCTSLIRLVTHFSSCIPSVLSGNQRCEIICNKTDMRITKWGLTTVILRLLEIPVNRLTRFPDTVDAGYKNTVGSREDVLITDMSL